MFGVFKWYDWIILIALCATMNPILVGGFLIGRIIGEQLKQKAAKKKEKNNE